MAMGETAEDRRYGARLLGVSLDEYDEIRADEEEMIEAGEAWGEAREAAQQVADHFHNSCGSRQTELYRSVASQLRGVLHLLESD